MEKMVQIKAGEIALSEPIEGRRSELQVLT
jgi:hypothetical protein